MFDRFKQNRRKQQRTTILAALFAGVAGAVAAVFLTPVTGKEARQKVKESAEEAGKRAREAGNRLAEQTREQAGKARAEISNRTRQVADKIEEKKLDVKDDIDTGADKASRATKAAKDAPEEEIRK